MAEIFSLSLSSSISKLNDSWLRNRDFKGISVQPVVAQISESTFAKQNFSGHLFWMYATIVLSFILAGVVAYSWWQRYKFDRAIKFEQYKNQDLNKKLKSALNTLRKMETNPDLIHAREFNLDYLKMRMDEEVFHHVMVNQIKMKVSQLITQALRQTTSNTKVGVGTMAGGRKLNETFEVTYEVENQNGNWNKGVLFRVELKLIKLPTHLSSKIVFEIVNCIETFLGTSSPPKNWHPTIENCVVLINLDQKAKPTPLLVLEQLQEGVNTTLPLSVPRS